MKQPAIKFDFIKLCHVSVDTPTIEAL